MQNRMNRIQGYLQHYGVTGLCKKAIERCDMRTEPEYRTRRSANTVSPEELRRERETVFEKSPIISILVPVYNADRTGFLQMLSSVKKQTYPFWQLCIADASEIPVKDRILQVFGGDQRIAYFSLPQNLGIAGNSNAAFALSAGAYIALLDQDDLLEPNALYEVMREIEAGADFIYTDEDKVSKDLKRYFKPYRKPDYNESLFYSNNYICHFSVMKRELFADAGGFRPGYDGAQDYDLFLRAVPKARKVAHVPKILYHWRAGDESTSTNPFAKRYAAKAGKKALQDALFRKGCRDFRVTEAEDPGYYFIQSLTHGKLKASVIERWEKDSATDASVTHYLLKPPEMEITVGSVMRLLERAYFTNADVVVPKQVCCKRYRYNGIAAAGTGYTVSLKGKPAWYRGPFNLGITGLDVVKAPADGILIRASLLPELISRKIKQIDTKSEPFSDWRMVYAPEVTVTVKRKGKKT